MVVKKSIWQKLCLICPLCNYKRKLQQKDLKFRLINKIESLCPICKLAKSTSKTTKRPTPTNIANLYFTDDRYRPKLIEFKKDSMKIKEAILKTYQKNLEFSYPRRPKELEYYEKILSTDERINEIKKLKTQSKKKIIGTFCTFVPEELIYACGAIPLRLCAGSYETISKAEVVLPRDICPLIKSSFGFKLIEDSYFGLCDLVIIPTTCDGKKKLGEILSSYMPVWMMELPQRKDVVAALNLWLVEIKKLKTKLEEFTKTKITRERLKEGVLLLNKRTSIFRRLYDLKKQNPTILSGRDTTLVIQASFYDDIERWIKKTEQLYQRLISFSNPKTQKPKILLTGAPIIWPNFKIFNIIEGTGAIIVADELCSGMQYIYNITEVNEWTEKAILEAISAKYLLPSVCPCFTESNSRIDRILNLIEEFHIDGIIHHSLRLCQLYDMELYKIHQVLKDKNIPFLTIHTDYGYEDIEQIRMRVEAFMEILYKKCQQI